MSYAKKLSDGLNVPSHAELYRDFHRIEEDFVKEIFEGLGYVFEVDEYPQKTQFDIKFEEKGWDIVIVIKWTAETILKEEEILDPPPMIMYGTVIDPDYDPDPEKLPKNFNTKKEIYYHSIYIEYKSSEEEWGKQFDAYIRQVKKRLEKLYRSPAVIVSFDPKLKDYLYAAEKSGFKVIVLSKDLLAKLEGQVVK